MRKSLCKMNFFSFVQCFIIIMIVLSIFAILWIRSNVLTVEYKLSQLEERKKALLREQKVLLAERASISSFSRIEKSDTYYLQFPDRKKVIYITKKPEDSITSVSYNVRK